MLIREVPAKVLLVDGRKLIEAHYREIKTDLDYPLAVHEGLFQMIEQQGSLISLGLFTHDNDLVGYCAATLGPHQAADVIVCSACAIFIAPTHRNMRQCTRLMNTIEEIAKQRGASMVQWHARKGSLFEHILLRRRCAELETVFVKKLTS